MSRYALAPISDEPYRLSEEGAKVFRSINAEIGKINSDRAALEADASKLKSTPASEFSRKHAEQAREHAFQAFDLKRRELAVRVRARDEWYPLRARLRTRESDAASARADEIRDSIVAKLKEIGYVDSIANGGPGITHDMLQRHPEINASRGYAESIHGLINNTDSLQEQNSFAIAQLTEEIESDRQRLSKV